MALEMFAAICKYGLLATTLFTFQDYACDRESLRIQCPRGSTISISWAQYGRLATSANNDLCPAVTWQPLSEKMAASEIMHDRPSPRTDWVAMAAAATASPSAALTTVRSRRNQPSSAKRITCLANSSLEVVVERCQGRQQCHLNVTHRLFKEDPCPNVGKYLEVAYQCQPSEFTTQLACENETTTIRCPRSRVIAVRWATYGHTSQDGSVHSNKCRVRPSYDTECQAPCALPVVSRACHGRQHCTLTANRTTFGRPCRPNTVQYLTVVYACVAERTLTELPSDFITAVGPSQCRALVASLGVGFANGPQLSVAEPSSPSSSLVEPTSSVVVVTVAMETIEPGVNALFRQMANTMLSDWTNTTRHLRENFEKFILYAIVGFCVGFILFLLVIVFKLLLLLVRNRRKLRHIGIIDSTDGGRRRTSGTGPAQMTVVGPGPIGEPSFVDSGRGSPTTIGGRRPSTPTETSRRGGGPRMTPRHRPIPFDMSASGSGAMGSSGSAVPVSRALGGGARVPLPPAPDSPVFVHVESPRESPLLGRAPPFQPSESVPRAGNNSNGPTVHQLRSDELAPEGPTWFRPSRTSRADGSSIPSSTIDLRPRDESPVWVLRQPVTSSNRSETDGIATTAVPVVVVSLNESSRPESYAVLCEQAVQHPGTTSTGSSRRSRLDDLSDTPTLPLAPREPAWLSYQFDQRMIDEAGSSGSYAAVAAATTATPSPSASFWQVYRGGRYSSSTASVSPASTLLATVSTIPRSSVGITGPRRAAAVVYPSSASLGPVPSLIVDYPLPRGYSRSPPATDSGPASASPSPAAAAAINGDTSSLTRSFSNPYRQDTYRTLERRPVSQPSGGRRSGRRRRLLRFE